jgi:hypothetical protein
MHSPHVYTMYEIELLRSAARGTHPSRRMPRRRTAPWRQRVNALLRESPQLTVFTLDAEEITSQLAHGGGR